MLLPSSQQSIPLRTEVAEIFGKNLANKGHNVFAIISSDKNRKYRWKGVTIYEISNKSKVTKMLFARRVIEEENCNIVLARNSAIDGITGLYLRWRFKIPLVFQYTWSRLEAWREKVKIENKKKFWLELKVKIDDFLQIKVLRRADLVLATSTSMKDYLVSRGAPKSKVITIPNGVDPALVSDRNSSVAIRAKYNVATSPLILYIGTMDKLRQLDFLIHVFRRVKNEIEQTKFMMIGEGNDRYRLEKIATELKMEKDVVFTGRVSYFEVPKFLSASDVTVSPIPVSMLYKVSSPLKVFEYMNAGKPVVANEEIPEQKEAIQKSGGGLVVPYNKESFTNAIVELINNPNKRERMGANGRKWVAENRSYDKLAEKVEKAYLDLLNLRGR